MNTLAAAIVLSLATTVTGQQPQPADKQQTRQSQPRPANESETAPQVAHAQQGGQVGERYQAPASTPSKDFWDLSFSDWVDAATFIVTAAFLYFTWRTWQAMVWQNKHAERAYEESTKETEESLRLTRAGQEDTKRAVKASEDQLAAIVRFARAQVTIGSILRPAEILPQGHPPNTVMIQLTNAGHTAAISVVWVGSSAITPKGDAFSWDLDRKTPTSLPVSNGTTIGANQSTLAAIEVLTLSDTDLQALIEGSAELRLRGRVRYRDIFSDNPRSTEFEATFNPLPHARWAILWQTED